MCIHHCLWNRRKEKRKHRRKKPSPVACGACSFFFAVVQTILCVRLDYTKRIFCTRGASPDSVLCRTFFYTLMGIVRIAIWITIGILFMHSKEQLFPAFPIQQEPSQQSPNSATTNATVSKSTDASSSSVIAKSIGIPTGNSDSVDLKNVDT